ncbi:MAG: protein FdrA, partial [candidate division GAL15 bacterium]
LREAGIVVAPSNAAAARVAAALCGAQAPSAFPQWLPAVEVPEPVPIHRPSSEPVRRLLSGTPRVVNVGLESFAQSLQAQGVPVVSVDWRPPAPGDPELLDLLARLGG